MALTTKFFGRYEHCLDAKGRLILPAKLRTGFGEKGYLTRHDERCLALWTEDELEREVAEQLADGDADAASRNRVRAWASAASEAEIDRQGRIAIPAELRAFARLESAVVVAGVINRVELWSPASWAEQVGVLLEDPKPAR